MERMRFAGFGGLEIEADSYGSEDDPIVLILPGGGQTRRAWEGVAGALAEAGRRAVCVDLRGHGKTARPADGRYDLDAFVGDLHAVLAQLPSRPVIVGASLGGWIAMTALGEGGPDLASALVVVDAPPHMAAGEAVEVAAQLRRQAEEKPKSNVDARVFGGMDLAGTEARVTAAAARIKLPTMIIRGAESRLSTAEAVEELARMITGAEVLEIEEAGHLVATDREDVFNAALLEFLERRSPLQAPEYHTGSDARTLRDALGCFATGVTIVTAMSEDGVPVGLTANSFTSVSLDPPLLLVCLANSANSLPVFETVKGFAVNVVHIGQQPVSSRFASRGEDRFAATPWESWTTGAPIITGSLASFECERHAIHDGGDHKILVGRVIRVRYEPRRDPLLYFRGKYRRLHFA
jgi:flavin reductase (DIM6/NTAB) family NADH-FMN oxidoreductase RutF/pimeloyl-ACP methyl ester carboxylesterase